VYNLAKTWVTPAAAGEATMKTNDLQTVSLTRRSLLAMAAGTGVLAAATEKKDLIFGFSLYGMKTVPVREALAHVAKIGYKCTELCLRAGWDTEPKLLTKADRADLRKRIGGLGLTLSSVMENMALGRPDGTKANLERLKAAAEVCYEVSPGPPALIETTVGGRPANWEQTKDAMAVELAAWAKTAEELKTTLAIKAHAATVMNLPERVLWLADRVTSPRLKLVYDYSHYSVNGLDMVKTMQQIATKAVFVHIKDMRGTPDNYKFLLPGDGDIDYRAYVKALTAVGYRGPVVVEVSVHVFDEPGYDPLAAARHVWERVSPAFV
jgi:sugar phosphate isomerase/epimerase